MVDLEICCGDMSSVSAALEGGASRIELCSGLAEGGLTPSAALIRAAVGSGIGRVNVLIRPRSGDFLYSEDELRIMEYDIRVAVASGATGIVIGALTPDGEVDMAACGRLIAAARENAARYVEVTFHRAFDLARDPLKSLEDVVALGCDCLLTSGMAASAERGVAELKRIVDHAAGRITVMAGSGVSPANAAAIIDATGVGAIHSTARSPRPSAMRFRREEVPMGVPGADEYAPLATSPDIVAALLEIAKSH
ncbi:MAG: copper homeostasis protein CutC [Muribaculaceae bacterium]|nr:copper homeostasis protein CutC [Muribaculaceae bacterium]MDE7342558.1 copper homeostasis protein CutC [Muribaculaceae bacterium]